MRRAEVLEKLLDLLEDRPLDQITVEALCEEAGIAPSTFYLDFGEKENVLLHFIQLWTLKMGLVGRGVENGGGGPLAAIEAVFEVTGQDMARRPQLVQEVIRQHSRWVAAPVRAIPQEDRLLFLDDAEDAGTLQDERAADQLRRWVARATEVGQLPAETPIELVVTALSALLFGVPLRLAGTAPHRIPEDYASLLEVMWSGTWTHYGDGKPRPPRRRVRKA